MQDVVVISSENGVEGFAALLALPIRSGGRLHGHRGAFSAGHLPFHLKQNN